MKETHPLPKRVDRPIPRRRVRVPANSSRLSEPFGFGWVCAARWAAALALWLPFSPLAEAPALEPPLAPSHRVGQTPPALTPAPGRTVVEWTFARDGELEGWQPNGHLQEVTVSGDVLTCRAQGSDPILEFRPVLHVPASPWHFIEVRLQADRDGTGEFFWSNTTEGRYGGFAQEKSTRFQVVGDGQWRTYRLLPFWHPEKEIVRLRFDLYDGARFAVDTIRIAELDLPPAAERAQFDFKEGRHGWQPLEGAQLSAAADGLQIRISRPEAFLLAPLPPVDAVAENFVAFSLTVDRGRRAALLFATEQDAGMQKLDFPIQADGQEHVYNLDLLTASRWRGRVIALGLQPSDTPMSSATLHWLKVSAAPQGPPRVKVLAFALEQALPRAGQPALLVAILTNEGGETAVDLQAKLNLPNPLRVVNDAPNPQQTARLGFDEQAEFSWQIQSDVPWTGRASLQLAWKALSDANQPERKETAQAPLSFTARPDVPRTDYVPEPKPVRGPVEVGVYYFPGWKTASQWHPIREFPERKPVLGWYREGDPEVADWHIKWAVEHGITFFAYDWYWSQGARQLEHALHEGYFQARYRHLLKFCLLWANHNPPRTSTHEDCLAVTRFWIEQYFQRPEHLTLNGQPVVIIFSPDRLSADLGGPAVPRAFDAMRAECRRAGLPGLYLIACVGSAGQARQAAAEGYDAVTAYNWPGLGMTGHGNYAPFETLLDGYRRNWQHIQEQCPVPLVPLPVCGGWDSRPWHGDNNLVRFGRTPALFQQHLLDAKLFLENRSERIGPGENSNPHPPIPSWILIEAWNEWGEGSYIEPHQEFGFGYLDAVRDVFAQATTPHLDLTPADVGLGPYDLPPLEPARTNWDFDQDDQGWNHAMQLAELHAHEGALTGRTTGNDPALFGPPIQARSSEFASVTIRMKLEHADGQTFQDRAQLFWRTRRLPESEATSTRFQVVGDGQWHEYVVPVSVNARWRGVITRLRLDPCNRADVRLAVASIRLASKTAAAK